MNDDSSSSRESSPRRFRPRSPGSETESVTPSPKQGSSTALHPSSFSASSSSSSNTSLLRQPVGFGASSAPAPAPTYHAPGPASSSHLSYSTQISDIESSPALSRYKFSKGKEKDKSKERSKDVSRKGKRDKGTSGQVMAPHSYPHPSPGHFSPDAHKKKAFRVRSYANDPSAGGSPYITQEGPYGAAYRADLGERVSGTSAPPSRRHHESSYPAQSAQDTRPRPPYYRCDYDKLRENTPANRAKQAAAASAAATPTQSSPSRHSVTPHQPYYPSSASASTYHPGTHYSRSKKRNETHMYPSDYLYPSADPYHGDIQHTLPTDYFNPAPAPQFEQSPSTHSPSPAPPPREKRHKSRSHRHEQAHQASPSPSQPSQPMVSSLPQPEAPVRVCRVLTLLIEDKRNSDGESMLTEVRVPLRQVEGGDAGFWADAHEVTEELQKGPSRIDGGAKVYTLRGKYKQYFLRISADGEHVCPPANLKVAPDRTLEIYIEDNKPPAGMSFAPPSSPPQIDRVLLTPVTDSMTSPSPAPISSPATHHKRASRSSLFSMEDYSSPEEHKFDVGGYVPSSKKRPRSTSIQSVQSIRSEGSQSYLQPYAHDAFSPVMRRPPSANMSTVSQSQTPSQSSPPPPQQPQPSDPVQTSPVSTTSDHSTQQQARTFPMKMTSSFPDVQPTADSSSASGPSPPKKAKLSVPQPQRHTEHSVSPGPSQPGSYPWSHSRSSPTSNEAPATGFAAYANISTKKTMAAPSVPNPFAQYESGTFSLPTPQSEASTTPASQGNLALPSVTAPIVPPTIPSLPPGAISSLAPMTMAPSAMTVTPTLSGQASSDLDNAVGKYIRGIIDKEPEWTVFVENRKRVLKVSEQLAQYRYVQRILDRFVNAATPADLEGAGGVRITKTQVMRAFNLPLAWGEQCTETLALTALYGPEGTRGEEARVVRMLDEPPAITTKITADKYLTLLREVHGQWTINNSG